ncbi:flagellar basal body P-ring protein FlgI [Zavarzinella formosa]|uniref:flagellar basal body P-ring protein FlgI n=1 Tax=Zavarzinella formosa TaxID=360055 RepID=UPI0004970C0A|nr:flagellar basal body P-ring protein FlgI [Zavarzinella formosa]
MKRLASLLMIAPLLLGGCMPERFKTITSRSQQEELPPEKDAIRTIRDIAVYDNTNELTVSGFGIVTGLAGTGGPTPPGDARQAVEDRLKKIKDLNVNELMNSPSTAIVVVTGVVKPGSRRDELVDLEITLPPGSKVKSLRGGVLQETPLMTFATQAEVRGFLKDNSLNTVSEGNRLIRGHEVVVARGLLQASLKPTKDGDEESSTIDAMKTAYVWKGGKLREGRPMFLILNTDEQRFRVAEQVATRLNDVFQGGESASSKVAIAKHKDLVAVNVPPRYRLNHPHFMRVVLAVPLDPPADLTAYLKKLEDMIQKPETAAGGAIKLEALGAPALPVLRAAMKSEYPFVQFCAAEALAYLGQTQAAETLGRLAAEHPAFQAYALTALAALDDALAMSKLEELLASKEPSLRYGAFRAMREIDHDAASIKGQWQNRSFVLHSEVGVGQPMVHMLREGRSEFVLFGETPKLVPPFSFTAGPNFTVTAKPGDEVATISYFSAKGDSETQHAQSALNVADVLRKMAQMGASYGDAAEMLFKAQDRKAINCKVVVDALPKAVPMTKLADSARTDPWMKLEYDLLSEVDEASTPTLFEGSGEGTRR